jgi:hypothetical protein
MEMDKASKIDCFAICSLLRGLRNLFPYQSADDLRRGLSGRDGLCMNIAGGQRVKAFQQQAVTGEGVGAGPIHPGGFTGPLFVKGGIFFIGQSRHISLLYAQFNAPFFTAFHGVKDQGGSVFKFMAHDFKEQIGGRVKAYGNTGTPVSFLDHAIGHMVVQDPTNVWQIAAREDKTKSR